MTPRYLQVRLGIKRSARASWSVNDLKGARKAVAGAKDGPGTQHVGPRS